MARVPLHNHTNFDHGGPLRLQTHDHSTPSSGGTIVGIVDPGSADDPTGLLKHGNSLHEDSATGRDWFDVKNYGLTGDGSTDDTAALQALITMATASGTQSCTIYFPPGTYIFGGALQDTGAFNGQILLPDVSTSANEITITFQGAARPPFEANGPLPAPGGYSILRSTLTGGSGTAAVFSGGNRVFANMNNISVRVRDLLCIWPNNPSLTFWNLMATQGGSIENLMIATLEWTSSGTTATHTSVYGVRLAQQGQSNYTYVDGLVVSEGYTGVQMGELTNLKGFVGFRCIVAVELTSFPHASTIWSMEQTACVYGIKVVDGTWNSHCDVHLYAAEHWPSPATIYDLDDGTNSLYGNIRWQNVDNITGADVSFLVNGGSNSSNSRIGALTAGGVTSVGLTVPAEFSVSGSPVTGSGTLAVTKANESANMVWAGPTSGGAAAPTFRALVAADLPASGAVGAILISDTPSTPLVFADLIQNEAQNDLVYADT